MRLFKSITVAVLLVLTQLPALGAELAVLRNGFSIRFEHKEQTGNITRLYTSTGYIDVASNQIASFEAEEAPVAPQPAPATTPQPAPSAVTTQPAPSITTAQSVPPSVATAQPALLPAATSKPNQPTIQAASAANLDLDQVVREAAKRNRLDPDFVSSVIKAESNFKTRAVSPKGAQGLMQLMPATAAQLGVTDPFDAKANVEAGTAHLSALLDKYHDDPVKALAAYNAGAHRVKQYNGVPPYRETRAYISKIVRDFNAKKRAEMKTAVAKTNAPSKPAAKPAKTVNAKTARKSKPQQAASLAGGN
jgi:soluble lytic murein transglycosylase-like protein